MLAPILQIACQHAISSPIKSIPRHNAREHGSQLVLRTYGDCCWDDSTSTGAPGAASLSAVPCATPFLSTGYVNNATGSNAVTAGGLTAANAGCKMVQAYTRTSPTRNFMPTERLSFQSTYVPKLEMSGSASYSNSTNRAANLYDSINEWTASTTSQVRDSIVSGPASANEIFVHANWSAIYSLTQKLRLLDSVHYDQWQNPGSNPQTTTDLFAAQLSVGRPEWHTAANSTVCAPGDCSRADSANICQYLPEHRHGDGTHLPFADLPAAPELQFVR